MTQSSGAPVAGEDDSVLLPPPPEHCLAYRDEGYTMMQMVQYAIDTIRLNREQPHRSEPDQGRARFEAWHDKAYPAVDGSPTSSWWDADKQRYLGSALWQLWDCWQASEQRSAVEPVAEKTP